jgi:hypothetical protein
VANPDVSPGLAKADRELLTMLFGRLDGSIAERRATEQVLHGEPHRGNVLKTRDGPLFIDFETCCRGPVEFDLAHVPLDVSERYPGLVDRELLEMCRGLVLAMVAAWRFEVNDRFPDGRRAGRTLLGALREGPPYPTLDALQTRLD